MKQNDFGGISPISISSAPNVVRPLDNEEILERRGENAVLVQMIPCPCPDSKKTPDCKACYGGYIRTFQEFKEIVKETVAMQGIRGNRIYPRYYPIVSVQELTLTKNGEITPIEWAEINNQYIQLPGQNLLSYWNTIQISYRARMTEELTIEAKASNESRVKILGLENKQVILRVVDCYSESGDEPIGFMFDSILFKKRISGLIRVKVEVINTIKLAYREAKIDPANITPGNLKYQEGDIELTTSQGYKVSEGDIVTLLKYYLTADSYISWQEGETDFLPFGPVKEILRVFSKENDKIVEHFSGTDFVLMNQDKILWLKEKPRNGYSIRYSYHPSYRIQNFGAGGGNEDKNAPRTYIARPIPSWRSFQ